MDNKLKVTFLGTIRLLYARLYYSTHLCITGKPICDRQTRKVQASGSTYPQGKGLEA